MKTIELTLECDDEFRVRQSDGYTTYNGLLAAINKENGETDNHLQSDNYPTFHNSGLIGKFNKKKTDRQSHQKYTVPGEKYELRIGFTSGKEDEAYSALINHFIIKQNPLTLTNGNLQVIETSTETISHSSLLKEAGKSTGHRLWFEFQTPVCITDGDLITTMLPHRAAVFKSLTTQWNNTAPEKQKINLNEDTIRNSLIEIPGEYNLQSHTVLTAIRDLDNSDNINPKDPTINPQTMEKKILRQGFTGEFGYQFKNASRSTQNAIRALAKFAEINGIGRATSKGCGATRTSLS